MTSQKIRVYAAMNAFEAHIVKAALEQAGIAVTMRNEMLAPLAGALPLTDVMAEVWIDARDADVAAEILQKTQGELSLAAEYVGGELSDTEERLCKGCGETNPSHFAECWSCQAGLD